MEKNGGKKIGSISIIDGDCLIPADLLQAKEKQKIAVDQLLRNGFRQSENLFGKYSYLNIRNVGKIPKEFYSLMKPRIVVIPPVHGNREVVEALSKKQNGFNWEWESISEIGVGFSGTAQVFAVESSDSPSEDTLGATVDELLSRENVSWSNLAPYLLAFYQDKEIFDTITGTCFPDLSKKNGRLFYCKFNRSQKFLSIWKGEISEDRLLYVGARRTVPIPLI